MQMVTSPDTAQLVRSNGITQLHMGWAGVKGLWRDAADVNRGICKPTFAVMMLEYRTLLFWEPLACCHTVWQLPYNWQPDDIINVVQAYLLPHGCFSFALVTSHTCVLVLCVSISALYCGCCTHTTTALFCIFAALTVTKAINVSHLAIYCPLEVKGSCLIFHPSLCLKKSDPWDYLIPAGHQCSVFCHVLHVVVEDGSENAQFWKRWKRNNSSAEILLNFCAWLFHRELSAVDPRWYIHNSSRTKYTQTLSRDIKESCLTLKIKLISCQDFTRACVTANDMLKPCKKKINMSNAKPITFCASLNYAHLYWFDTQLAWQQRQSVCCHKLK